MPPAPRKTPMKKVETVSVVDQLADDAESVELPTEYPEGAPALRPMLAIRPFSKRAAFKRAYAEVAEMKTKLNELQVEAARHEDGTDGHYGAQLRMWAAMDDIFEKVNAALRLAAVDVEDYDRWSDSLTDDNHLMTTFNVYQSRTQPGEA